VHVYLDYYLGICPILYVTPVQTTEVKF